MWKLKKRARNCWELKAISEVKMKKFVSSFGCQGGNVIQTFEKMLHRKFIFWDIVKKVDLWIKLNSSK